MKEKKQYIQLAIGLLLILIVSCCADKIIDGVTPVGSQVLGIFVGTIYLWLTIDATVASLISIAALAISDFGNAGSVLATCFGNATVIQMFFMMVFMAGLTNAGVTAYIARFLITRKIIEGRPYVFIAAVLLSSLLLAAFINVFFPVLLFWPVLYEVFKQVGYKENDSLPQLMISSVGLTCLIGFPVAPYMGNALVLIGNYQNLIKNYPNIADVAEQINNGSYFIFGLILSIVLVSALLLVILLIFKPDVSPLKKLTVEMLEKDPLPRMNEGQKLYGALLVVFMLSMLLPSLFPSVFLILKSNMAVIPVVLVAAVCLIHIEQKPLLSFNEIMKRDFSWPAFWLCTAAILLGGAVTNESTGITGALTSFLSPLFNGMSASLFAILLVIVSVFLTNLCNSLIIGMVLQPVVMTYCDLAHSNPVPFITILSFSVLATAFCTPAANPIAAMVFANKEYVKTKNAYKFAFVFVAAELIILLISTLFV